jgi:hypothetical protein
MKHSLLQTKKEKTETIKAKKLTQNPSTTTKWFRCKTKKDLKRKTLSSQIGDGFIFA